MRRALGLLLPASIVACADPSLSGQASRSAGGGETPLKVAAWNIEWLADQDGQGTVPREPADYERLKKYADQLDADIVALAEVEGQVGVSKVFDPAVYDIHIADNDWVQRTGFAYRKSLDITVEPDYYDLSLGDSLRSGAVVRFDTPTHSVRFMAVHLKASCPSGPLDASSDCETLAAQVPILEGWIDDQADQDIPFVVLGDFNRRFFASGNEEIWAEIDDGEPSNADLYSPTEGAEGDCWGWTDYIDHIVMDRQVTEWYVADSFVQQQFDAADNDYEDVLSDHCPISAELLIPGGGGEDSGGESGDSGSESSDDGEDGSDSSEGGDPTDDGADSSDGGSSDGGSSDAGSESGSGDSAGDSADGGSSDSDDDSDGSDDGDDSDDAASDAGDSGNSDGDDGGDDGASADGGSSPEDGGDGPPPSGDNSFEAQASCACRQGPTGFAPGAVAAWFLMLAGRPRRRANFW